MAGLALVPFSDRGELPTYGPGSDAHNGRFLELINAGSGLVEE
jgi:hypothetical protein